MKQTTIEESIFILEEELKFYQYQLDKGSRFANYPKLIEITKTELAYLHDSLMIFCEYEDSDPTDEELNLMFETWEKVKNKKPRKILA